MRAGAHRRRPRARARIRQPGVNMNRTEVLNLNRTFRLAVATLFATLALAVCTVARAAPPAGTPIGNQASATYLDATSTSRTVTSNLVTTIVQQRVSFTLTRRGPRHRE